MSNIDSISDLTYNCENTSIYALQFALKTMQERCQQLQKRLATVEDENYSLKMKYCNGKQSLQVDAIGQKTEVEMLKDKIAQLSKQKSQLTQNIMMVAAENRNLWNRLSKLSVANNSLGSQLLKINDTLNKHKLSESVISPTSNLIRSKTFTQHSPRERQEKREVNGPSEFVSLEEISLKLIDRLSREKADLEEQCAQMAELQSDIDIDVNSIGFAYPDDSDDDSSLNELTKHSEKLNTLKEMLLTQQQKLRNSLEIVQKLTSDKEKLCKGCQTKVSELKNSQIQMLSDNKSGENSSGATSSNQKICPMCGKIFRGDVQQNDFQVHVEEHFVGEDDAIVDNYEIITTLGT